MIPFLRARPGRLTADEQAVLRAEYSNMLACIRCGQCLTSCPTFVLTGSEPEGPRGRIALARALVEGTLPVTDELIERTGIFRPASATEEVVPPPPVHAARAEETSAKDTSAPRKKLRFGVDAPIIRSQ